MQLSCGYFIWGNTKLFMEDGSKNLDVDNSSSVMFVLFCLDATDLKLSQLI